MRKARPPSLTSTSVLSPLPSTPSLLAGGQLRAHRSGPGAHPEAEMRFKQQGHGKGWVLSLALGGDLEGGHPGAGAGWFRGAGRSEPSLKSRFRRAQESEAWNGSKDRWAPGQRVHTLTLSLQALRRRLSARWSRHPSPSRRVASASQNAGRPRRRVPALSGFSALRALPPHSPARARRSAAWGSRACPPGTRVLELDRQ